MVFGHADPFESVFRRAAIRLTGSESKRGSLCLLPAEDSRDLSRLLVEQAEGPHGGAGRHVDQIGIAGAQRIDPADAAHDGHVLLAVPLPGDGLADDAGPIAA